MVLTHYVFARLRQRPVRTPRPDQEQLSKHVQALVVTARYFFFFRFLFFVPQLPLFFVVFDLRKNEIDVFITF
jgi:hypothetical protein